MSMKKTSMRWPDDVLVRLGTCFRSYSVISSIGYVAYMLFIPFITIVVSAALISVDEYLLGSLTLLGGFAIFYLLEGGLLNRPAARKAKVMLSIYDDECDPQSFVDSASSIVNKGWNDPERRWFFALYAEALLDLKRSSTALRLEETLMKELELESCSASSKMLVASMVPLAKKTLGPLRALELARKAHNGISDPNLYSCIDRIHSRLEVDALKALASGNHGAALRFSQMLEEDPDRCMRKRVEAAWDAAHACRKLALDEQEVEHLRFVVEHGNKLAIVAPAKRRLGEIDGAQKDVSYAQ